MFKVREFKAHFLSHVLPSAGNKRLRCLSPPFTSTKSLHQQESCVCLFVPALKCNKARLKHSSTLHTQASDSPGPPMMCTCLMHVWGSGRRSLPKEKPPLHVQLMPQQQWATWS